MSPGDRRQGGGGVYNRYLDADPDGDNDSFDKSAFDRNYLAAGDSVEVSGRAWSPSGLWYGYTGRQLDPETGLLHYRARAYHPTLKQFTRRDPMGYLDSASLSRYVTAPAWLDPSLRSFGRRRPAGSMSPQWRWSGPSLAPRLAGTLPAAPRASAPAGIETATLGRRSGGRH